MPIINRGYASNQYPGYAGHLIINLPLIPGIPDLVSSLPVHAQGFDVDFG